MELYFSNLFGHERSLISLLSLADPDILKQSKVSAHGINIIKNLAPENLNRWKCSKVYIAMDLFEKHFSD